MDGFKEHFLYKGYFANDLGDIYSIQSNKILQPRNSTGTHSAFSYRDRNIKYHRFIFSCFYENDISDYKIGYIDGDIYNNHLDNLINVTLNEHFVKNNNDYDIQEFTGERIKFIIDKTKFNDYKNNNDLSDEIWKTGINEFNNINASNKGRFKINNIITYGNLNQNQYIGITVNGKYLRAHRVICSIFHGEPPSDEHTTVDHINEIKYDNRPENLRWATLSMQAETSWNKPITVELNGEITEYTCAAQAAKILGNITRYTISDCIWGKINSNENGYIIKFKNEDDQDEVHKHLLKMKQIQCENNEKENNNNYRERIIVTKENVFIGEYNSSKEAIETINKTLLKDSKIKLESTGVSKVIQFKRGLKAGFTFERVYKELILDEESEKFINENKGKNSATSVIIYKLDNLTKKYFDECKTQKIASKLTGIGESSISRILRGEINKIENCDFIFKFRGNYKPTSKKLKVIVYKNNIEIGKYDSSPKASIALEKLGFTIGSKSINKYLNGTTIAKSTTTGYSFKRSE